MKKMLGWLKPFTLLTGTALVLTPLATHADDGASLHSIKPLLYTVTFSGLVACEGHPVVGADVDVILQTTLHRDMKVVAKTQENGIYSLVMSFEEYPDSPMDWRVVTRVGGCSTSTAEGHHILTDETQLRIARLMDLDTRSIQVAKR